MAWSLILYVATLRSAFAQPGASAETSIYLAAAPAPAAAAGVSSHSNKKIRMVTETLKDILQSVVNSERQETEIHSKYMSWCDTETAGLANDLREAQTELKNAKVLSEEQVSSLDNLKLFITKSEKDIEETNDAMAQAAALRTSENEKYTEDMQISTQSLRQIDLAIDHVGGVQKQGGFLQNGQLQKLQVNQPGESSYVLGVMKGLKDKLEKTRAVTMMTEKEKVKMHNSFMETKASSLKAMGSKTVEKKILNTEVNAKEAATKRKIAKLKEEVGALTASSAKTGETCQTTQQEWTLRQEDRTKEKAALNEAIRYMMEIVLEQVSLVEIASQEQDDSSVVFAPEFFQEVTESLKAAEFYKAAESALMGEDDEVGDHMQKDTFNGVSRVVQKLIDTHQTTQTEEGTKKKYCDSEIAAKEDERDTTEGDLAAVRADIEKKASEAEMLADEVKMSYESMDQVRKSVVEAGKLRKEEMAAFLAGTKDRALAVKVLNQAKSVLQNFYAQGQGKLVQVPASLPPSRTEREEAPAKWSKISPRKKAASFGVVAMVQQIADDIAEEQKDAAIEEKQAQEAFEELQVGSQSSNEEKQQDITDRVVAKAKLGVQINTLKETVVQQEADLESIKRALDALHGSCDELVENFDQRKKSRTFEVNQLKDVKDILSGSAIAARTGLMQQDSDEAADAQQDEAALNAATARYIHTAMPR